MVAVERPQMSLRSINRSAAVHPIGRSVGAGGSWGAGDPNTHLHVHNGHV